MTDSFELPIGVEVGGEILNEVTPLPADGIAEKVVFTKNTEKLYTWMGRVITILTKDIDGVDIGEKARAEYGKTRTFKIPEIVLNIPLADVMSAMIKLHAAAWEDTVEDTPYLCSHCGHQGKHTLDLNKFGLSSEFEGILNAHGTFINYYRAREIELKNPFAFQSPTNKKGEHLHEEAHGKPVWKLVFRLPTLKDAIKHEKLNQKSPDNIDFWKALAKECLTHAVIALDADGAETIEIPATDLKAVYGDNLFDSVLSRKDLVAIRKLVRDEPPIIDYFHTIECANCGEETPLFLQTEDFFSE